LVLVGAHGVPANIAKMWVKCGGARLAHFTSS
jgi:hypothetical protein